MKKMTLEQMTVEQMERFLEEKATLKYNRVFKTKDGFGAASFGRDCPNVTFFIDNGPEMTVDNRPYSPFMRGAI